MPHSPSNKPLDHAAPEAQPQMAISTLCTEKESTE